jgi:hypothetical protein
MARLYPLSDDHYESAAAGQAALGIGSTLGGAAMTGICRHLLNPRAVVADQADVLHYRHFNDVRDLP